ncbi:MAG: hypothetical protein D6680_20400 [Cyanobacteria bacterium J007]|nr:MAG: hypothetical protein D6680_20400 [Cyanobacteria bacterium J007]
MKGAEFVRKLGIDRPQFSFFELFCEGKATGRVGIPPPSEPSFPECKPRSLVADRGWMLRPRVRVKMDLK